MRMAEFYLAAALTPPYVNRGALKRLNPLPPSAKREVAPQSRREFQ